jgi:F0F1-type ATP synthase membrane subunit b/b'
VSGNGYRAGSDALRNLALRLTDPQDRETFGALVSHFQSLPPGDDLAQFVQMLGLLSLAGQRIPDALADFLQTFRAEIAASAEYRTRLEQRLASLPEEIAAGVQPEEIAAAMAESFRQQIAEVGLERSGATLRQSTAEVKALYLELSKTIKPAVNECKTVAGSLSEGVDKILKTSSGIRAHNTRLAAENQRSAHWVLGLWVVVLVLVGVALVASRTPSRPTRSASASARRDSWMLIRSRISTGAVR